MTEAWATESPRLKQLVNGAWIRNTVASMLHFDASAMGELPVAAPHGEETDADRYARLTVEGPICWRDRLRSCRWPR